jgi:hypothetical protein
VATGTGKTLIAAAIDTLFLRSGNASRGSMSLSPSDLLEMIEKSSDCGPRLISYLLSARILKNNFEKTGDFNRKVRSRCR